MGQLSEHESRYSQELHTRPDATDASSFDDLAKGLATGTLSRGKALRMVGAALVGVTLASIPGAAWAACKQPFSKCTANTQCCSRRCIRNPKGSGKICGCPTGKTLCPAGNQCVTCTNTGEVVNQTTCKCECPSGQVVCNNACVSNVCDPTTGEVFNQATCKCECLSGKELCGGKCLACPTLSNPCQVSVCVPATGTCETQNRPDGTTCSTNLCQLNQTCINGTCQGGTAKDCRNMGGRGCNPDTGNCECHFGPDCPSGTAKAGQCGLLSGAACAQDFDCCSLQCTGSNPNKKCA